MISEGRKNHESRVGFHYDHYDEIYRRIWGESLHHGLWVDGVKSMSEACDRMTEFIGQRLSLGAGERLLDVGCGYGRMASELAACSGAEADGVTISRKQWEQAVPGVHVELGDWLENRLADESYDAVMAIESLEHMSDLGRAVAEMARVVKPGGRIVIACWVSCDEPADWERRWLIEPACRDGLLDGMASEREVRHWLGLADLELHQSDDLSRQVENTWQLGFWRALRLTMSDREMRRMIMTDLVRSARMALTLQRIWIGYVLGTMRYVVFSARRPD